MFFTWVLHYQKFGPFSSTDREAFGIPYSDAVTFGQMFIGHADLSFYHKQNKLRYLPDAYNIRWFFPYRSLP